VEETFYLFAPFLLVGLAYKRRLLYAYPFLILALGLVLIPICHAVFPHLGLMKSVEFMLELTFFGRCTEFIIGIGLYFWLRQYPASKSGYATIVGVVGILLSMVVLSFLAESPNPTLNYVCKNIVTHVLIPFPIALLFWGLITEQTRIRRLLETKTFDLLGKSSYVFYLIHLGTFDSLFRLYITDNWVIRLVAYVLTSIALYKFIESPLHKRLRSK
jgi:peptidoglycan/LPS O-acetylase OafA/YrhL